MKKWIAEKIQKNSGIIYNFNTYTSFKKRWWTEKKSGDTFEKYLA